MKIRPVGAELFHTEGQTGGKTDGQTDGRTDGQTDMMKLIVAFRNITNAPKISASTSQKTHSVPIMKTDRLLLFREIIFVHSENHREYINTL